MKTLHQRYMADCAARRKKIARMSKEMKPSEIARALGLSRERVRQILARESK